LTDIDVYGTFTLKKYTFLILYKYLFKHKIMKTKLRLLAGLLLLATVFTSCDKDDNEPDVSYTVTFNADGGTPTPQSQTVKAGEKATAPTNPTKQGYVFLFWYISGSTTAYNFATPVNSNITLQSKWEDVAVAEYWKVTWSLNGGSWPSDDNHVTQVVKGGTLVEPNAPVKSGSTFEGWYMEPTLTNKINFPYNVNSVTSNITLYAKWVNGEEPNPGDRKMFTSTTALSSWLSSQSKNTAEKAYKVGLKDINLDSGNNWGDLGIAIGDTNSDKYIDLDLNGCTGMVIPDGKAVSSSGKITYYGTFINCDNLVAIKLPATLTTIGTYAFRDCEELVSVVLPETVKSINNYAFAVCYKLEAINLPDGLQAIGRNGFYLCNLKSVVIPEGITTIDENTFNGCDLISVILPESLQTIGRWAFDGNENLTSITIPANVNSISGAAFAGCKSLAEVIMRPVTPPTMVVGFEGRVFEQTHSSLKIKVPEGSVNTYKTATGWKDYADRIVANTK